MPSRQRLNFPRLRRPGKPRTPHLQTLNTFLNTWACVGASWDTTCESTDVRVNAPVNGRPYPCARPRVWHFAGLRARVPLQLDSSRNLLHFSLLLHTRVHHPVPNTRASTSVYRLGHRHRCQHATVFFTWTEFYMDRKGEGSEIERDTAVFSNNLLQPA